MATQTVTRIGVLSVARVLAVVYAFLGLLIGGIVSLFAIVGGAMGAASGDRGGLAAMFFGAGAVIVLPILYGCIGFVGGLITAPIYNLVAKIAGGVEVDLS